MTSAAERRRLASIPITVGDVRYERAVLALCVLGSALAAIALAYFAGFLVGRLGG
jgi:hypothetical protein